MPTLKDFKDKLKNRGAGNGRGVGGGWLGPGGCTKVDVFFFFGGGGEKKVRKLFGVMQLNSLGVGKMDALTPCLINVGGLKGANSWGKHPKTLVN